MKKKNVLTHLEWFGSQEAPGSLLLCPGCGRGWKRGKGWSSGERSSDWDQWFLGDLHLETDIIFPMGVLETALSNEDTAAGALAVERLQGILPAESLLLCRL